MWFFLFSVRDQHNGQGSDDESPTKDLSYFSLFIAGLSPPVSPINSKYLSERERDECARAVISKENEAV